MNDTGRSACRCRLTSSPSLPLLTSGGGMPSMEVPCLANGRCNFTGSAPSRREPDKCSDAGSTCNDSRGFMPVWYQNHHRADGVPNEAVPDVFQYNKCVFHRFVAMVTASHYRARQMSI